MWIDISDENAERMLQVLRDFGMGAQGLKKADFLMPGYITQIGYPPLKCFGQWDFFHVLLVEFSDKSFYDMGGFAMIFFKHKMSPVKEMQFGFRKI